MLFYPAFAGWKIELGQEGCLWLCKVWTEDGVVDGLRHKAGQYKKAWEVLRDEGTFSYRMIHNDKYKVGEDFSKG